MELSLVDCLNIFQMRHILCVAIVRLCTALVSSRSLTEAERDLFVQLINDIKNNRATKNEELARKTFVVIPSGCKTFGGCTSSGDCCSGYSCQSKSTPWGFPVMACKQVSNGYHINIHEVIADI